MCVYMWGCVSDDDGREGREGGNDDLTEPGGQPQRGGGRTERQAGRVSACGGGAAVFVCVCVCVYIRDRGHKRPSNKFANFGELESSFHCRASHQIWPHPPSIVFFCLSCFVLFFTSLSSLFRVLNLVNPLTRPFAFLFVSSYISYQRPHSLSALFHLCKIIICIHHHLLSFIYIFTHTVPLPVVVLLPAASPCLLSPIFCASKS